MPLRPLFGFLCFSSVALSTRSYPQPSRPVKFKGKQTLLIFSELTPTTEDFTQLRNDLTQPDLSGGFLVV